MFLVILGVVLPCVVLAVAAGIAGYRLGCVSAEVRELGFRVSDCEADIAEMKQPSEIESDGLAETDDAQFVSFEIR